MAPGPVTRDRLFGRRLLATTIDDGLVAVLLGIVALVNLVAIRRGRRGLMLRGNVRLLVPCIVTVPVAVVLGCAEHTGGSPGKRTTGLRLSPAESRDLARVSWSGALTRSLLKTALPWELGHQAVWQFRKDRTASGGVLAALAYGLLIVQAIGAARRGGQTYADLVARTIVVDASAGT